MASTEHDVERSELRWAGAALGFVGIIFALTLFAALALQRNPPSNSQMYARVRVVPQSEFRPDAQGRANCGP
jgi:hypothetical protein